MLFRRGYWLIWTAFFLLSSTFSAQADRVTDAWKALQKDQPERARKLLDKELAKNPQNAGAKYIYALTVLEADTTDSRLDSAYVYLQQATQFFPETDAKTRKKWQKYGITDEAVTQKKAYVDSLGFNIAQAAHTEAAYQSFVNRFPNAKQRIEALQRRNQLAFAEASRVNTYDSYKIFLEKYPDSQQAREAEKLYELLLYEFHTKDDDVQAYELFIELYPKSPYRAEAEKQIYELFTAPHTRRVYYDFIKKYTHNNFTKNAWHWLFTLYKEEKSPNTFLKEYSDFYDKEWLQQLVRALPLAYFPIYEEETQQYGFMDAEGRAVIPTRYDSVASDYFCDGVKDPFLLVYQQQKLRLIDKTGRPITAFGVEEVEALEDDLLLVRKDGKAGIVHLGGFPVLDPHYDAVELLDETFITVQKGNQKGLIALNGRKITPIAFDEIRSLPDGILAFQRNNRYALITRDQLLAGRDTAWKFTFDRIEPIRKGYFKVCTDSVEAIVDARLNVVLSAVGKITSLANYWAWEKNGWWQLFNEAGKAISDTLFHEVLANEAFIAARSGNSWALWRSTISPRLKFDYDTVVLLGPEGFAVQQGKAMFAYFGPDNFIKLGNYTKVSLLRLDHSDQYWVQVEDKSGKKGLYNPRGSLVLPVRYEKIIPWRADLFCIQVNGRYGLVNQAGKTMLPPSYAALDYQKDGYIATLRNGKFGLIQTAHDLHIQPQYDKLLKPYDETGNLFIAVKNGRQGFITSSNQPISDFAFDDIQYWQQGVALVKQNQMWHLYHLNDKKYVFKPIEDFRYIRQDKDETILKIYAGKKYGILSNVEGVVVNFEYDDLRNVGTEQIPFYLAENYVDETDVYMVFYIDRHGKRVHRQLFDQKRYERIVCE